MLVPWWWPFGQVEEITPLSLQEKIGNGARFQVLDVREPFEFEEGHVRGAVNVPIQNLPRVVDTLGLDPDRPIVAVCLSGHRSKPAFRLLKRKGYQMVYSLSGGMLSWRRLGLPTARNGAS